MNFILLQAAAGASASGKGGASQYSFIILMLVMVVLMYFTMIRPQKKRQKEEQEMRSSLEIGDEIITIGGIVGCEYQQDQSRAAPEGSGSCQRSCQE